MHPPAVIIASLLPVVARVPGAHATVHIATSYPFSDGANITVVADQATIVKVNKKAANPIVEV